MFTISAISYINSDTYNSRRRVLNIFNGFSKAFHNPIRTDILLGS